MVNGYKLFSIMGRCQIARDVVNGCKLFSIMGRCHMGGGGAVAHHFTVKPVLLLFFCLSAENRVMYEYVPNPCIVIFTLTKMYMNASSYTKIMELHVPVM